MNISEVRVLNDGVLSQSSSARSLVVLSKGLQKLMLKMKGSFMSADGRGIDYKSLQSSKLFEEYQCMSRDLQQIQVTGLTDVEKTVLFLNIYNALTIHGLAESHNGTLPSSVLELSNFWKHTAYNIGGYIISLDDIEHGILRGNRPHPSSSTPIFAKEDPRCELVLTAVDPRIHFALVCGAKSCPAINVYSESNLEHGLAMAASSFCSHDQEVHIVDTKVTLSKIFIWYKSDFASDDISLLRQISGFLSDEKQVEMEKLIKHMEGGGKVDITAKEYNWNLNKL